MKKKKKKNALPQALVAGRSATWKHWPGPCPRHQWPSRWSSAAAPARKLAHPPDSFLLGEYGITWFFFFF